MDRRTTLGTTLIGLALVLFVLPALLPVQPVLYHNTHPSTSFTPDAAEDAGMTVVRYEALSKEGQELYVATLENGGRHFVAHGEGAPEFSYPTQQDRRQAIENGSESMPGTVLVVRPNDSGHLPPPDEHGFVDPEQIGAVNETGHVNETMLEAHEQRLQRFDTMDTYVGSPPLNAPSQLLRLGAAVLAVVFLGCGGYLLALPPRA